jgi:hypothetical protein
MIPDPSRRGLEKLNKNVLRNVVLLASVLVLLGLIFLGVSWQLFASPGLDGRTAWLSELSLNVGISLLLFIALFLVEHQLEKRLSDIESNTREQIARVDQRVSNLAGRIDEALQTQYRQEQNLAQEALAPIEEHPTSETIADLLEEDQKSNLVTKNGPRVMLPGTDYCVRFVVYRKELDIGRIWLQIEDPSGTFVADTEWEPDWSPERVSLALVDSLVASNQDLRREDILPGAIFSELQRLLAAVRRRASGPDRVRRAVQPFGNQWILTESGIQSLERDHSLVIDAADLDSERVSRLLNESWVDGESLRQALATAHSMPVPLGTPTYP